MNEEKQFLCTGCGRYKVTALFRDVRPMGRSICEVCARKRDQRVFKPSIAKGAGAANTRKIRANLTGYLRGLFREHHE